MDGAALVRRHRLEGNRLARARHSAGDVQRQIRQRLVPSIHVAGDVDLDAGVFPELSPGDQVDKEVQRAKGLPSASDEKPRVVTIDIEDGAADPLAPGLSEVSDGVDPHAGDELVQRGGGHLDGVRWGFQEGNPNLRRLRADPENARLTPANDVYLYLLAIYVELL